MGEEVGEQGKWKTLSKRERVATCDKGIKQLLFLRDISDTLWSELRLNAQKATAESLSHWLFGFHNYKYFGPLLLLELRATTVQGRPGRKGLYAHRHSTGPRQPTTPSS